jgi:phage repressor protein C with HTH and peptisase S24 domain
MNTPSFDILEKILLSFDNASSEWLMKGIGPMFSNTEKAQVKNVDKNVDLSVDLIDQKREISPVVSEEKREHEQRASMRMQKFSLRTDNNVENQQIPLYDLEAVAGLVPLFNDTNQQTPIDYISIPNLPKCDGAVYITGDSMYPLLKSGDIVLYKQVNDILNSIFWGEMYLISIDVDGEEYITVKFIQKSEQEGSIKLVSQNQHHQPRDIEISRIKALAFIKASIRMNAMH